MEYKCKGREKEYQREYRLNNKENTGEYQKQYRLANKERTKKYNKEYHKQWYLKNKEKVKERSKQYYLENKKYCLKHQKEYQEGKKEHIKEYGKKYRKIYKEKIKERKKQYRLRNEEKIKEHYKQWLFKNYEKYKENRNNRQNNKRRTNLKFNLNHRMSRRILHPLKGNKNGWHWEGLVGYTINDLEKRLKSTMPNGYTWNDFLSGELHIDHIIPVSVFNFTKPEDVDFKRCWALKNLQLLPANENLRKSNKLLKPFQPALKIKSRFEIKGQS